MTKHRKLISNILICTGILFILYFIWINYSGRIFQAVYSIGYDETDESQTDDFFSYNDIPDVFLAGQGLINTTENPMPQPPQAEQSNKDAEPAQPKKKPESKPGKEPAKHIDYSERKDYNSGDIMLVVPRLGVKCGVANGTTAKSLKSAPGLYDISDLPTTENGRVLIAAHRDVYGSWFYNIDKMRNGDKIKLIFGDKIYIYEFVKTEIVEKADWSITDNRGYSAVVLTSCTPKGTSEKRITAVGKLVEIVDR